MNTIKELVSLLDLESKGNNRFEGHSFPIGSPNVFGGQVVAQALNAANKTVSDNKVLHSLHSYFLEPGNLKIPVMYHVEEVRNGNSFATRRVKATQNDITIFILAASFHKAEEGFEHQKKMKTGLKHPDELMSWDDILEKFGPFIPKGMKLFLSVERPIEFKPTNPPNPLKVEDSEPVEDVWFRIKGSSKAISDGLSTAMKQQILAYVSDYNILTSPQKPNASNIALTTLQTASLDHSMWFYRDFDLHDWMLFSSESPNSYGARGLGIGSIFSKDGVLIASFVQEGLLRPKK